MAYSAAHPRVRSGAADNVGQAMAYATMSCGMKMQSVEAAVVSHTEMKHADMNHVSMDHANMSHSQMEQSIHQMNYAPNVFSPVRLKQTLSMLNHINHTSFLPCFVLQLPWHGAYRFYFHFHVW